MKMLKNPTRFFIKLYCIIWGILIVLVLGKLLFGYYQPYVMPNDKMQMLSDFIDRNKWLEILLNSIFYIFNGIIYTLIAIKQWWFKKKWHTILIVSALVLRCVYVNIFGQSDIITLIITIGIPLIIDYKKWLYLIIAFALSNVFLLFSMWFNGNTNSAELPYLIRMLFLFDYYIMIVLEYITTNLIKIKKEKERS